MDVSPSFINPGYAMNVNFLSLQDVASWVGTYRVYEIRLPLKACSFRVFGRFVCKRGMNDCEKV